MKAVIQRVTQAQVSVDGEPVGRIGPGFLILVGVMMGDTPEDARLLAAKTASLRVFEDEAGKMNRSLLDTGGAALVVSQFTLCADCHKGNRPSFSHSAPPDEANRLYRLYAEQLHGRGVRDVRTGRFAAHMQVSLVNNGPVTILFDTADWLPRGPIPSYPCSDGSEASHERKSDCYENQNPAHGLDPG